MIFNSELIPLGAKFIIEKLNNFGHVAYLVGGCVRDMIMNKEPHDWDICTSALPKDIVEIFNDTIPTGIKHGTITVKEEDGQYEVTTFRIDGSYSDGRRPDKVTFTSDIVKDLSRRDFTINAIAYNPLTDELIDPFKGCRDISVKIIRAVGDPIDRFNEDKLRILRAIRFACQFDFLIDKKIVNAIKNNFNREETYNCISNERICSEFIKIFSSEHCWRLFNYPDVLLNIIPEFKECYMFNQNNPYHTLNLYDHIQHSLLCANNLTERLALIFHDIGKPKCKTEQRISNNIIISHYYGHAKISSEMARNIMTRLRFDSKIINDVCDLIFYHDSQIVATKPSIKKWLNKLGKDKFSYLLDVKFCDITAQNPIFFDERSKNIIDIKNILEEIENEDSCFSLKDLAINGNDLINNGFTQGKQIGDLLNHLLNLVIENPEKNNKDTLLNLAKTFIS